MVRGAELELELQLAVNAVVAGAGYAGLGASFCLIKQANGFLDLSFAAAFLVAAYVSLLASANELLALTAAVLSTILLLFWVRPLARRNSTRSGTDAYQTLCGFGTALTATGLVLLFLGPKHYAGVFLASFPTIKIGDAAVVPAQYLIVVWMLAIALVTALLYAVPGRLSSLLKAHGENRLLALHIGLPVAMIERLLLIVAGIWIAGLASLQAWDTGMEPHYGIDVGIEAMLVAFIAGARSPILCMCVGFIFGVLQHGLTIWIPATWKEASALALLLFLGAIVSAFDLWRNRNLAGASEC